MIDILKNKYGFTIKDYKKYNNGILFFQNDSYFYFTKTLLDKSTVLECYEFSIQLNQNKLKLHEFVFNKNNELLTDGYVLFKLNHFIDKIDLKDLIMFNNINVNISIPFYNMYEFWQKKIDYLEKQISELSDNSLVNYSFDYFLGIGEVLLQYLKDNYISNEEFYLSHRTLYTLNTIDFYNPLNIVLGERYKDYVSYVRLLDDWELFSDLLDNIDYNDKVYVFVRMCFPFKYFDFVSDILLGYKKEEELAVILNEYQKYEEYLYNVEKASGINLFRWIKKE